MKKSLRMISLLVAMLMTITVLCSCSGLAGLIESWYEDKNSNDSEPEVYYRVTYVTDGGSHTNPDLIGNKSRYILKDAYKSGWLFRGWYSSPDFTNKVTELVAVNDDIILYAKYVEAHSIVYNLDGGVNNPNNPQYYGEDLGAKLLIPSKVGHNFLGWYDSDGRLVNSILPGTVGTVTVTARWTIGTYSITWDLRGGSVTGSLPGSYTFGEGVSSDKFKTPTRVDMIFAGWYTVKNGSETHITEISPSDDGNYEIYAKWISTLAYSSGVCWTTKKSTYSSATDLAKATDQVRITVPNELKDLYIQGKLGIKVTATLYAKVMSQGNATGTAYAYLIVNGQEKLVCKVSAKGGGYSYWNGFWTVPQDGAWASNQQTVSYDYVISSLDFTIGYRFCMTSDKDNSDVETSLDFGCVELTCTFYVL